MSARRHEHDEIDEWIRRLLLRSAAAEADPRGWEASLADMLLEGERRGLWRSPDGLHERARDELDGVHLGEVVDLLVAAAELRIAERPTGSALLGPGPDALARPGWRQRALEELRTATRDGLRLPAAVLALALGGGPSWSSAEELSAQACALRPTPAARLTRARAALAAGSLSACLAGLAQLDPRDLRHAQLGRLAATRAAALELRGRLGEALPELVAAAGAPGAGLYERVVALGLALVLGCEASVATLLDDPVARAVEVVAEGAAAGGAWPASTPWFSAEGLLGPGVLDAALADLAAALRRWRERRPLLDERGRRLIGAALSGEREWVRRTGFLLLDVEGDRR